MQRVGNALRPWIGILSFILIVGCSGAFAATPNVLILYVDDMGYGDLGCQNPDSKIPTPHLDRLAAEGIRFTDGHSSSGICTPSRYALLTGRYHWRKFHGIVGAMGASVFEEDRLTLPEMMQMRGYHTAAIGKWHLGWDWDAIRKPNAQPLGEGKKRHFGPDAYEWDKPIPDGPLAHGFDTYFGDTVINFPPYCWIENDRVQKAPDRLLDTSKWKPIKEGSWECRPGPMAADWDPYQNVPTTVARGVEFLRSQAGIDRPFFLYFAFPSPHAPIIPNDRFDGASDAGAYGDYVVETDDACGRLLQALDESGKAEETLVVFTADNGAERYAYARDRKHDHWSSAPFRGLKRDLYEGGHHVPFVIRWPQVVEAGRVSEALVSQIDLMATLSEVLGSDLSGAAEDSYSFLPVLKGESSLGRQSLVLNTYAKSYAVRDGPWLLVNAKTGYHSGQNHEWEKRHGYPADEGQPIALYDLSLDPGQRKNLAASHGERVAAMQELLKQVREQPDE